MYCFHDKIRIYFMSFIVQISPFVHLFTLKIVFHWGANPTPGLCPRPAGGLKQPPDPSPQVVPTFHFIPSYAPDWDSKILLNFRPSPPKKERYHPIIRPPLHCREGWLVRELSDNRGTILYFINHYFILLSSLTFQLVNPKF